MDLRRKQTELVKKIRTRAGSEEVKNMVILIESLLEQSKDKMVDCKLDEFTTIQGEARAYNGLLVLLSRKSVEEMTTPAKS